MSIVNIKLSDYDALIFDMDGTMVDNMRAHKKAWRKYIAKHGKKIRKISDKDFRKHISGNKNDKIFAYLLGYKPSLEELAKLADEKEALYRKLYKPEISEVLGLTVLVNQLHDADVKLAIATTSPKKNREFILKSLRLENEFDIIVGEEHVIHGKPNPEIYLNTAKQLGVPVNRCLVFEDSPPGVLSAKEAGMKTVAVLTSHTEDELSKACLLYTSDA